MFPALPAISAEAKNVDRLAIGFVALAVLLAGSVFVMLLAFAIRYRRGKIVNREHAPDRSVALEVSWSLVPFLLVLGFFVLAARLFIHLHRPPPETLAVDLVAKQWMWKFQHPEGQGEINVLHVPAGRPVLVTMTSQDVIHSLYIPALRLKQDVVPGRYTQLWFNATVPGTYALRCAEYCGTDHAAMGGAFIVLAPADYTRWLATQTGGSSLAVSGGELYRRLGCASCHGAGTAVRAPPLGGLYGATVPLADGRSARVDDNYLRTALFDPNADVAAGYPAIMPSYRGAVGEEDALRLVAYLKALKSVPGARR